MREDRTITSVHQRILSACPVGLWSYVMYFGLIAL